MQSKIDFDYQIARLRIDEASKNARLTRQHGIITINLNHMLDTERWQEEYLRISAAMDLPGYPEAASMIYNYWYKLRVKKYVEEFKNSGGNGVITPDLPPDESDEWIDETDKQHIDRVFVVAPSTSEERLKLVSSKVTGFVYAASLMGVTGTRNQISQSAETLVTRLRKVTDLPVAVGLGVSTPEQAKQVAKYADGVIVGSAFIKLILQTKDLSKSVGAIGQLAKDLARSMHRN